MGLQLNAFVAKGEEHAKDQEEQAPSLDEMLRLVSTRSAQLRRSVTIHRHSLQHHGSGDILPEPFDVDAKL